MRQRTTPERAQNKIGTLYAYYRVLEVPSMHETENWTTHEKLQAAIGTLYVYYRVLVVPGMHETENYPRESTGCNWYEGSQ